MTGPEVRFTGLQAEVSADGTGSDGDRIWRVTVTRDFTVKADTAMDATLAAVTS